MSTAFWYSLLALCTGIGLLVVVAGMAERALRTAANRRLTWVACLAGIATLIPLIALGIPFCAQELVAEGFRLISPDAGVPITPDSPIATGSGAVPSEIVVSVPESAQDRENTPSWTSHHMVLSDVVENAQTGDIVGLPVRADFDWKVFVFLCVWGTGTAIGLGWVGLQRWSIRELLRTAELVADPALIQWISVQGEKLGLKRTIRLVSCAQLETPVAFGTIRPTIAVPGDFPVKPLSVRSQAIFIHELSHLAAGDPFWNLLASLVKVLLWWYPITWIVFSRLKRACEEAADEATILLPNGPRELAAGLVECARNRVQARAPVLAIVRSSESRSVLARRVRGLLSLEGNTARLPRPNRRKGIQRAVVAITTLAVFLGSMGFPIPEVFLMKGDEAMRRQSSVWRHSLIAAAITAFAVPWGMQALAEEGPKPDRPRESVREDQPGGPRDREVSIREEGPRERGEVRRPEGEGRRPEGEARRDQPREGGRIEAIERKLEELRHALREVEEAGQQDRAEQLRAQIRDMEAHLRRARGSRPPEGGIPPEARVSIEQRTREAREIILEKQMGEVRERLREAREAGREELVRDLERRLEQLEKAMRDVREGRAPMLPPRGEVPPMVVREQAMERLERAMNDVRERLHRAREGGREEEVRELEQQLGRMEREMAALREGRPPLPPPGPMPPERVERARRAAELLRREGFGDMADLLMRSLEREMRPGAPGPEPGRFGPPGPPSGREPGRSGPPGPPRRPDRPEGRPDRPEER